MHLKRRLMLLAGSFSLLAGVLFVTSPGRTEHGWRLLVGGAWLLTGALWLLAYWLRRRGASV